MVDTDLAADARRRMTIFLEEGRLAEASARIVPLAGDASDRRYFRVARRDGTSVVLALHAGPIDFATLPFATVANLLLQMPLPVPTILGHSDPLGIIALEDLGDVTLQAHLDAASASDRSHLYHQAVELIERLQRRGRELASDAYLPYRLAFDHEKLTWELEFFVRHFLEAHRRVHLHAADREALADEWASIVGELADETRVLCHRDYHSRNLMVRDGALHVIDFQDARMGPDTYDLASLLRDSYVDITDDERDQWLAYFLALAARGASREEVREQEITEFRRRFDLMAVQRNLKALGTFGYQAAGRGNLTYVQYVPRTLGYIRENFLRHARFGRLHDLLATHLDELR